MGWVRSFNSSGYAGYNDWRLPTVEEATSLLESRKFNGLYIDPIFSNKQTWIWTGDKDSRKGQHFYLDLFVIRFRHGYVDTVDDINELYVRPVRSVK